MRGQSLAALKVDVATLLVVDARHEREEKRAKRTAAMPTNPTMQQ